MILRSSTNQKQTAKIQKFAFDAVAFDTVVFDTVAFDTVGLFGKSHNRGTAGAPLLAARIPQRGELAFLQSKNFALFLIAKTLHFSFA